MWNHQSRPALWFQVPVQVSFSQGKAEPDALLVGMSGVVGVVGDVPVIDRPLKLPHPNLEMLDEGDMGSSGGGMEGFPLLKQLTPTPAAYDSDWFEASSCFHPIKPPSNS